MPTIRVGVNARGDVLPRDIISYLRTHMVQYYAARLSAKPDQGRGFEVVRRERVSNHFLRTGKFIRFCDWCFVHRARLGVLSLSTLPEDGKLGLTKDVVNADIASKRPRMYLAIVSRFTWRDGAGTTMCRTVWSRRPQIVPEPSSSTRPSRAPMVQQRPFVRDEASKTIKII